MTSYYLPPCCWVRQDGAGGYEVAHTETDSRCKHAPSGGTGGYPDGKTKCNRIIGSGRTRREAIINARQNLGLKNIDKFGREFNGLFWVKK